MPGQFLPPCPEWAARADPPFAGAPGVVCPTPVDVVAAGAEVVLVAVPDVVVLVLAALAIAAPPPVTTAVTASVVSRGLIRWLIGSPPLVA